MLPFVTTFLVDSAQGFTPMRVRKGKKGLVSTYSDNFAVEVISHGLPRNVMVEKNNEEETSTWNLRKEGGWEEYKELTEKCAYKVEEIVNNSDISIEECMKKIDKVNNMVKFGSFGKTRKNQH